MALTNKQIYNKTIGFSVRRFFWNLLAWVLLFVMAAAGFIIADKFGNAVLGLGIGIIVGGIIAYIMARYVGYTYKAGQIAMMTKGVSEGKLPDDTISAGKKVVKERFTTVAVYYAATGAIKGIFAQIGQGITSVGKAVGGNTGEAVGSTVSSAIQTIVRYLCDCCLGWVFYRKDEKATKATLEGAVIFFKHGKTLAKNLGRVFGMGLISLILIGGAFTGVFYLIAMNFPDFFNDIANRIAESGEDVPEFITNVTTLMVIISAFGGLIMWEILHSTFVRPFVLVGVLRNYIESGKEETISEKDFAELDKKSSKFKKLHEKETEE